MWVGFQRVLRYRAGSQVPEVSGQRGDMVPGCCWLRASQDTSCVSRCSCTPRAGVYLVWSGMSPVGPELTVTSVPEGDTLAWGGMEVTWSSQMPCLCKATAECDKTCWEQL